MIVENNKPNYNKKFCLNEPFQTYKNKMVVRLHFYSIPGTNNFTLIFKGFFNLICIFLASSICDTLLKHVYELQPANVYLSKILDN